MPTSDNGYCYQFGFNHPRPFARVRGDASAFILGGPAPYPAAVGVCSIQKYPDHPGLTLCEIEDVRLVFNMLYREHIR